MPKVGELIGLPEGECPEHGVFRPAMDVTVIHSFGVARLCEVEDDRGQRGVIAFQPDGSWWWVREIEPKEPWEA